MFEKVFQMGTGTIFCPVNSITAYFELGEWNIGDTFYVCFGCQNFDFVIELPQIVLFMDGEF